jgi:hypothetical protein
MRCRDRLLLFFVFVLVFAFLSYRYIMIWQEIGAGEKGARAIELLLVVIGAWVVVWSESFPQYGGRRRGTSADPTNDRRSVSPEQ